MPSIVDLATKARLPAIYPQLRKTLGIGDGFSKGSQLCCLVRAWAQTDFDRDRTILSKISKRGNRYLRVLFVQAAWVVLVKVTEHVGTRLNC